MFRLKHLSLALSCLLTLNLAVSSSRAQDSTGIRLGHTDFGGQRATSSDRYQSHQNRRGSFNNNASDPHVYEHRQQSSDRYTGSSSRYKPHHDRRSYGNDADDPHYYKYRDRTSNTFSSDADKYKNHGRSYGIRGHRSFGLSSKHDYDNRRFDYNQRRYRDYDQHQSPYGNQRIQGGIYFYSAPIGYSTLASPAVSTVTTDYYDDSYSSDIDSGLTQADAWEALGEYEFDTARYAFESLIQQQPNAALPKIGFAFSTALSGELQTGAYAMEQALLSNLSDLRYFSADQKLQLVFEELLLSYQADPLMTATLYYFTRDYRAANKAVNIAVDECQQCTAVINLEALISQHI